MLSNAYFLAKFRFDTAENEPAKNLQNFVKFCKFAKSSPPVISIALPTFIDASEVTADVVDRVQEGDGERIDHHRFLANFREIFARFQLYRRRSLQENTRFAAFFKVYQIIKLIF